MADLLVAATFGLGPLVVLAWMHRPRRPSWSESRAALGRAVERGQG